MKIGQELVIQDGLAKSIHFFANLYNLLHEFGPKAVCFSLKKVMIFIRVFGILVISHPF